MDDDGSATLRSSQRARLTCSECYRRKIKCDKNVPCGTCIKRGIADLCNREENVANRPTLARDTLEGPTNDLVRTLLHRVSQLETMLHQSQQTTPRQDHEASQSVSVRSPTPANNELPGAPDDAISLAGANNDDAATVLEFLAWGRKKDVDFANAPEHESGPGRLSVGQTDSMSITNVLTENTRNAQLDMLEALLPSKAHIRQLVEYHSSSLLWYHGSYSSKIFSEDLHTFFTVYEADVHHNNLNHQWLALLFAILTGSMTCASPSTYRAWGFSRSEKLSLSMQWYKAAITCLNVGDYIEVHTIYSVQAIATLTISAHILGNSNSQSVLLASAGRIAQSLGLHKLGSATATVSQDQLRKREAGRRVFNQLCTQDWFSIPFSETYALNPKFFHNVKPLNCNDDDMIVQSPSTPTQASYCNYRYDIASLMPQLLDDMADCNTLFTKYEKVLKYDDKMRKLATAYIPTFLSTNAPMAAEWPNYVSWARRSLTICAAHKIIMIHRKFVGLSFTNTAFSFTRRTCLAASKTILKEAFAATDQDAPALWIDQAFAVAAGIILSLDILHRKPSEKEFEEHRQLVTDTIEYLKRFDYSKIASRGVHLLSSLQQELERFGPIDSRKRTRPAEDIGSITSRKRARIFDVQTFIRDVSQNLGVTSPAATSNDDISGNAMEDAWDVFNDLLPLQIGFDGEFLFDELLRV